MANAIQILEYLPYSFKTRDEQDYINFLWESYESNYSNGKYPFAFIAFHMLYMSFVYFEVWQIKETRPEDFEKAMVGLSGKNAEIDPLISLESDHPFSHQIDHPFLPQIDHPLAGR